MLVITTPTGNTGRYVLQSVLDQGESIRVLVRDPSRLDTSTHKSCEVVPGDLCNPADLKRALDGAEAVFFCVPQSPNPEDISAYYRSFADPFAKAVKAACVQRVVTSLAVMGVVQGFRVSVKRYMKSNRRSPQPAFLRGTCVAATSWKTSSG